MGEAVVGRTDKTQAESLATVRSLGGGRRARPADDQASRACVAVRTRVVAGEANAQPPVSGDLIGGAG